MSEQNRLSLLTQLVMSAVAIPFGLGGAFLVTAALAVAMFFLARALIR